MTELSTPPVGMQTVSASTVLGRGEVSFAHAREALRRWRTHDLSWLTLHTGGPPACGQTVLLDAHLGPLTWLFGCRVVAVWDTPRLYAFAYGTLPGHPERGEERFQVEWHEDDRVTFQVLAYSRPANILLAAALPLTLLAQKAGTRAYLRNMEKAVTASLREWVRQDRG